MNLHEYQGKQLFAVKQVALSLLKPKMKSKHLLKNGLVKIW